jgi:hypothetical protein
MDESKSCGPSRDRSRPAYTRWSAEIALSRKTQDGDWTQPGGKPAGKKIWRRHIREQASGWAGARIEAARIYVAPGEHRMMTRQRNVRKPRRASFRRKILPT